MHLIFIEALFYALLMFKFSRMELGHEFGAVWLNWTTDVFGTFFVQLCLLSFAACVCVCVCVCVLLLLLLLLFCRIV